MSQNPDTKDYIIVLLGEYCNICGEKYPYIEEWCKPCQINDLRKNFTNWTSENEKINDYIQEKQLKINEHDDLIFELIPYNQFNEIKEISKCSFASIYSTIWKDGPLHYNYNREWIRDSNKEVTLKCLYNSQNNIDEFLNEVKDKSDYDLEIYGISQNPDTKDYIIVFQYMHCESCKTIHEWFISNLSYSSTCHKDYLKKEFKNWTSENKEIDNLIQEKQLKIDDPSNIVFEWIPYNKFSEIEKIGKGGFATVYSAVWKDGTLHYDIQKNKYKRSGNIKVALKCLNNSKEITNEFINEVQEYSTKNYSSNIIKIYGISQNPDTKDYIIVLEYAEGGSLNDWIKKNYKSYNWFDKLLTLFSIIGGLKEIHEKQMVHCDFHTGNILIKYDGFMRNDAYISDMGLCGKVDKLCKKEISGVMPYVAPEVLMGKPYTQAADIYSFGMIMYVVVTGKQPFANHDHNEFLAIKICKGSRPEIIEPKAPKCYIDLMKKCLDPNPTNRPRATAIYELVLLFCRLCIGEHMGKVYTLEMEDYEIKDQFKKAEEYRKSHSEISEVNIQSTTHPVHPQTTYVSRLLNPFTKDLEIDFLTIGKKD